MLLIVAICTRNPRKDYLERALAALALTSRPFGEQTVV